MEGWAGLGWAGGLVPLGQWEVARLHGRVGGWVGGGPLPSIQSTAVNSVPTQPGLPVKRLTPLPITGSFPTPNMINQPQYMAFNFSSVPGISWFREWPAARLGLPVCDVNCNCLCVSLECCCCWPGFGPRFACWA